LQLVPLPEDTSHNPISGEAPWISSALTSALIEAADSVSGEIVEVSSVSSCGGVDLVCSDDDAADASIGEVEVAGESASFVVNSTDAAMSAGHGLATPRTGPGNGGRRRRRGIRIGGMTGLSPGSDGGNGGGADGVFRMSPVPPSPASPSDHNEKISDSPPTGVLLL
jgi:hypothetical protein